MIKKLKLQKAVIVLILGVIALGVYQWMGTRKMSSSVYALEVAGFLFMVGALLLLYPLFFAKEDKEGEVQLDPDEEVIEDKEV
ncbi:drug/metabolite transporter superfamily protein YnfA [Pedobacter sp. CG_S7]|uniref:isoleucyl-tRNA synthetase n=1 Tax=Pedobacter sp. CG_S7 TaxID=3143930 RepID=UPI003395DB45